ncbi:hypothetical protein L9F63_005082, partial [Diploptera punctata]
MGSTKKHKIRESKKRKHRSRSKSRSPERKHRHHKKHHKDRKREKIRERNGELYSKYDGYESEASADHPYHTGHFDMNYVSACAHN